MIGIISVFGMQSIQDVLKGDIKNQDMKFLCDDCANEVTALTNLEQHKNTDVVILNHGTVKNLESVVAQMREISKTVRIILILNGLRKQYVQSQLDGYRSRYNIEDIIFEGNGIDRLALLSTVGKGALKTDTEPPQENIKKEFELPGIRAKPEKKDDEENQPLKVESEPKPDKAEKSKKSGVKIKKPKHGFIRRSKNDNSCLSIAVFGTTHGAGATNMVTTLAEFLSLSGKKVIALNLSGGTEFQYVKGKAEYKDMRLVETGGEGIVNGQTYGEEYDIILIDLGTPFMVDADGQFCGVSSGYPYKNVELLKACSLKIVMALSDAWHINKAEYFMTDDKWRGIISNDYIFLFDKEPPLKNKYNNINMFNRNSQSFADEIARLFL